LLNHGDYQTICDSSLAAQDLWMLAKDDLVGYVEKAAQRHRLKKNNLDDVIEYCHTIDLSDVIPVLENDYLVSFPKVGN
ncbi:MAG TPA: 2-phosphosulfolactate phosphatase, partial [Bacteroidales bacterium]|nr:2-phosphosulfolactate phosphatase [Bacteroidales bacterium]